MLKYLHEEVKAPWGRTTAAWAAEKGHLHILEYLVECDYDEYDENACGYAALDDHFDCLKYLHEPPKRLGTLGLCKWRTRTTTPNVYNTSWTTTARYQTVGDTSAVPCTLCLEGTNQLVQSTYAHTHIERYEVRTRTRAR